LPVKLVLLIVYIPTGLELEKRNSVSIFVSVPNRFSDVDAVVEPELEINFQLPCMLPVPEPEPEPEPVTPDPFALNDSSFEQEATITARVKSVATILGNFMK
jgi:hypothetical protein